MQLIFNELCLAAQAQSRYAVREWLEGIYKTADKAIEGGFDRLILIPEGFLSAELANGYSFSHWLQDSNVSQELKQALQSLVSWGPFLEQVHEDECGDRLQVSHEGQAGVGLAVAVVRDRVAGAAVLSISTDPWQEDPLVVDVQEREQDAAAQQQELCNLYCADAVTGRLRWIAERCCVKPRYVNPGHHDPTSATFRGGHGMTTELPADAQDVYQHAIPDLEAARPSWWGQNTDGYLYRYQGSWSGSEQVAHWNGTTALSSPRAIKDDDIPRAIREAFPDRRR